MLGRFFAAMKAACVVATLWQCAPGALAGGAAPYDIVYVRQPRHGDLVRTLWAEAADPGRVEPGADLMLLRADGSEEVLVAGGDGAVVDPFVSFDAEWVYQIQELPGDSG